MIFINDTGRVIPVPRHDGQEIKPGLLRRIIRDAGVSVEEFTRRMG